MNNFFELLNIEPTDDLDVINKAYREYARQHHPDKGGDPDVYLFMSDERGRLKDPSYRKQCLKGSFQSGNQFDMESVLQSLKEMREELQELKNELKEMRDVLHGLKIELKEMHETWDNLTNQRKQAGAETDAITKNFATESLICNDSRNVLANRGMFFSTGTLTIPLLTPGVSLAMADECIKFQVYDVDYTMLWIMIAVSSIAACSLLLAIYSSCRSSRSESVDLISP